MTSEPSPSVERLGALAESAAKVAAAVTGMCFLCGLLVTNLYLLRWGIVDFAILKIKYVLTGATYLAVNACIYSFFLALIYVVPRPLTRGQRSSRGISLAIALAVMTLVVYWLIGWKLINSLVDTQYSPFSALYKAEWPALRPLITLGAIVLASHLAARTRFWRKPYLREVVLFAIGLLWLANLTVFARDLYPKIGQQFGGGRSLRALVLLNEGVNDHLPIGLRTDRNPPLAEWALLHEKADEYVLAAFNTVSRSISIVSLPKNATVGFVLDEKQLYERSIEDVKAGAINTAGASTWKTLLAMHEHDMSIDDMCRQTTLLHNDVVNFLLVNNRVAESLRQGEDPVAVRQELSRVMPDSEQVVDFLLGHHLQRIGDKQQPE